MPPNEWTTWLEQDMAFTTKILLTSGRVTPMYILHTRGGQKLVIGATFESDNEKHMMHMYVQLMCVAHDVIAFSFHSEAWMRAMTRESGESLAEMQKRASSEHPSDADRKEIISVTLVYRDEEAQAAGRKTLEAIGEIVRDSAGKVIAVTRMDMPAGGQSSGAILKILPNGRPNARQRQTAQDLLEKMMDKKAE
jgi:hypothetical protein